MTIMKKFNKYKNQIIPLVLCAVVSLCAVFIAKYPFSFSLGIYIILIPVLVVQRKTNNKIGQMWLAGVIGAIVYVVLLLLMIYLAQRFSIVSKIVNFPYYELYQ